MAAPVARLVVGPTSQKTGTPPVPARGADPANARSYVGARYYRPDLGRFTTVDPGHVNGDAGDPQSWSPYASVRNNPLRFTDPSGTHYLVSLTDIGDLLFEDIDSYSVFSARAYPYSLTGTPDAGEIFSLGQRLGTYRYLELYEVTVWKAGHLAARWLQEESQKMAEGVVTTAVTFGLGLAVRAGIEAVSAARAVGVVFKTGAKIEAALASAGIDSSLARRAVEHLIRSRLQTLPAIGTRIEGFVEIEGRVLKITAGVSSTGKVVVAGIRVVR